MECWCVKELQRILLQIAGRGIILRVESCYSVLVFARSTCFICVVPNERGPNTYTFQGGKILIYNYIHEYITVQVYTYSSVYLYTFPYFVYIYMFVYECFCIYRADHRYTYNYIFILYDTHYIEISIYRHIYIYLLYILHTGVTPNCTNKTQAQRCLSWCWRPSYITYICLRHSSLGCCLFLVETRWWFCLVILRIINQWFFSRWFQW